MQQNSNKDARNYATETKLQMNLQCNSQIQPTCWHFVVGKRKRKRKKILRNKSTKVYLSLRMRNIKAKQKKNAFQKFHYCIAMTREKVIFFLS